MEATFAVGERRLGLFVGDITRQDTDAIVSAANALLLGGGGVDGAIHKAAGPRLLEACRALKKTLPGGVLAAGGAVLTPAFDLPARHVVHAVGPIYAEHEPARAAELLASCYQQALGIAGREGFASITFPSISTGVYGYPVAEAAGVALAAVRRALEDGTASSVALVRFSLFDPDTFSAYRRAAEALLGPPLSTSPGPGSDP